MDEQTTIPPVLIKTIHSNDGQSALADCRRNPSITPSYTRIELAHKRAQKTDSGLKHVANNDFDTAVSSLPFRIQRIELAVANDNNRRLRNTLRNEILGY